MRHPILVTLLLGCAALLTGCDDDDNGGTGDDGGGTTGEIATVVNVATTAVQANDLRGLSFAGVAPNAGKIYVSGHVGLTPAERKVVVGRFTADGTPDADFGGDGFVEVDVGAGHEESYAVVELTDGDVVVLANATEDAAGASCSATTGCSVYLLRFGPDGTQRVSPAWGDVGGKVEVVFGWASDDDGAFPTAPVKPNDVGWDLELDKSSGVDRLVVFGFGPAPKDNEGGRTDQDRYVTRVSAADGAMDNGFNSGLAFNYDSAAIGDNTRRGLLEADGKIVSAGYANLGTGLGNHVIMFRLNTNGSLDASFAGFSTEPGVVPARAGVAVFNPLKVDGGVAECYGVARQSTGAYVTTGYGSATATTTPATLSTLGYESTLGPDVVSFRIPAGVGAGIDTSWGQVAGTQVVQSEGQGEPTVEDRGRHLVALDDDRTIQVGRYGGNAAAFVLTSGGQLDTRINGDGILRLAHPTIESQFFAAAVAPVSGGRQRIAMTTNEGSPTGTKGARLVVLETQD
jgi:uncharacterized delta-60 repeat protein